MPKTKFNITPNSSGETMYTSSNLALANALVAALEADGWLITVNEGHSFTSASASGTTNGRSVSISTFSVLGRGETRSRGSFLVSFGRDLYNTVLDKVISPEGDPETQAAQLISQVNTLFDDPLSHHDYRGLGLFSPVTINESDYIIGNALFNDKTVTVFTRRDFDSFQKDIDGVKSSSWVNGRWEYLGKDSPISLTINQLEELTGRSWGKKEYKRESYALKRLETLPRCFVVRCAGVYLILPLSGLSAIRSMPNVEVIKLGSLAPCTTATP